MFPKEKAGLYLSCASLASPSSVITSYLRRNREERRAAACAHVCSVLLSRGKRSLLTALPKLPAPWLAWEPLWPGWQSGGLSLPKHTQPREYILSTSMAPLQSSSGRRVGGRGCALCGSLPLLGGRDPLWANGSTGALAGAFKTDHKKVNLQYRGFYRLFPWTPW